MRGVSKGEANSRAVWFETPLTRLLTMRDKHILLCGMPEWGPAPARKP